MLGTRVAGVLTAGGAVLLAVVTGQPVSASTATVPGAPIGPPGLVAQSVVQSNFNRPQGVAVDSAGDVFVADTLDGAVVKVAPGGTETTVLSGLQHPTGVAVDGSGTLYVSDPLAGEVIELAPGGGEVTLHPGQAYDVAVDPSRNLYVALGQDVCEYPAGGASCRIIGPSFPDNEAVAVAVDGSGDVFIADAAGADVTEVGPSGTTSVVGSGLNNPTGVAVDGSGDVYVILGNSTTVTMVEPSGTQVPIGSGLYTPHGVAVGSSHTVYVGDTFNNRVVALRSVPSATPAGSGVSVTWAPPPGDGGSAITSYTVVADDFTDPAASGQTCTVPAPATSCTLSGVRGGDQYVFLVSAANAVGTGDAAISQRLVVPPTAPSPPTGSAASPPRAIGGASITNGINGGMAVSPQGDVYVATSQAILEIPPGGPETTLVSGLSHPNVAVDAFDNVYYDDGGSGVLVKIAPDGTRTTLATGLTTPYLTNGIAVNPVTEDVVVAEVANGQVIEVSQTGAESTVSSTIPFSAPCSVAVDPAGNLFVDDIGANLTAGHIVEVAPDGSATVVASGFQTPVGVAVDAGDDVFVADLHAAGNFGSVLEVTPAGTRSDLSPPRSSRNFFEPMAVAAGVDQHVYFLDNGARAVDETDLSPSVTVDAPGSVTVEWAPPFRDGGAAIDGYTVTAADLTTPSSGGQTCQTSSTSCTVTGLAFTDNYDFQVTATNSSGTSQPATTATVVTYALASMTPGEVAQGVSGEPVTLSGVGFQAGAVVTAGSGISFSNVVAVNDTTITADVTVPATVPVGPVVLKVSQAQGTVRCKGCLKIVAAPTLTGLSPSSVATGTKTQVTITGTGFAKGAALSGPSGVTFSHVRRVSSTEIRALMTVSRSAPTGSQLPVTVTNAPAGGDGTATAALLTVT